MCNTNKGGKGKILQSEMGKNNISICNEMYMCQDEIKPRTGDNQMSIICELFQIQLDNSHGISMQFNIW